MKPKSQSTQHDVGGVLLNQPFRIRRLGHVGLNCSALADTVRFYVDTLGFRISDQQNVAEFAPPKVADKLRSANDATAYLLRHNTEHHTFFLTGWSVIDAIAPEAWNYVPNHEITVSQISWQVGSLEEIVKSWEFLRQHGVKQLMAGRDMPGSNWHTYTQDPEGNINELFYGMEQVGWLGLSKPMSMYSRAFDHLPSLPQISEWEEVNAALRSGFPVTAGYRHDDKLSSPYNLDGILAPRPFKIVRVGPIGIYSSDAEARTTMYRDTFGLKLTEASSVNGKSVSFMRVNTEHHSLAIVPLELRASLGLGMHSKMAWIGFQVGSYRQLKAAVAYLRDNGHKVIDDINPSLHLGIDRAALTFDPEGHCVMLYSGMEQIGSDGAVSDRRKRSRHYGKWPNRLDDDGSEYLGETLIGPVD